MWRYKRHMRHEAEFVLSSHVLSRHLRSRFAFTRIVPTQIQPATNCDDRQRLNMDNVSRLMAMYDEDGWSYIRHDTRRCSQPHAQMCLVVAPLRPSSGSGTIDRDELKALLQDLCDA